MLDLVDLWSDPAGLILAKIVGHGNSGYRDNILYCLEMLGECSGGDGGGNPPAFLLCLGGF